jgi:hypothetical protein
MRDENLPAYQQLLRGEGCPACGGEPPCRNCGHVGREHRPRIEVRSVYDPQTEQHIEVTPALLERAPWLRWRALSNGNYAVRKRERGPCWGTGYENYGHGPHGHKLTGRECGCTDYQPEATDDAHADHLAHLLDEGEACEDWDRLTAGGADL